MRRDRSVNRHGGSGRARDAGPLTSSGWTDPERWYALRDGSNCPICRDGPRDVVGELAVSWITLPPLTPLPGYVCLVAKRHVVEPFELPLDERMSFWEDTNRVAAALDRTLSPVKLNYEIHGNTVPHLHVHLFPRQRGDAFEGRPIDGREARRRTDGEVATLRRVLGELARNEPTPRERNRSADGGDGRSSS